MAAWIGVAFWTSALLAAPAAATEAAADWRDLHDRCATAIATDTALDTEGLRALPPPFTIGEREDPVFGTRITLEVARLSARTVPAGIWVRPGGRFELRLIEYPAAPGLRAICEIRPARPTPPLTEAEGRDVADAFAALRDDRIAAGTHRALDAADLAMVATDRNPRDCAVTASLTRDDGFFRASVGERAGDPSCGGLSLEPGRRARQEAAE
jgi:hypothetical protein